MILPQLQNAIDNLYTVFACYPYRSDMEACPCCVDDKHKQLLTQFKLSELPEENLTRYAHKAISTWGDVDDFKHFLPRILEIASTNGEILDYSVIDKLEYAKWQQWKEDEVQSINALLNAWWANEIYSKNYLNKLLFVEIKKQHNKPEDLLINWQINTSQNSIKAFTEFIQYHLTDLINRKGIFSNIPELSNKNILNWVLSQKPTLETAFFDYETSEPDLATEISNSLYILEHSTVSS